MKKIEIIVGIAYIISVCAIIIAVIMSIVAAKNNAKGSVWCREHGFDGGNAYSCYTKICTVNAIGVKQCRKETQTIPNQTIPPAAANEQTMTKRNCYSNGTIYRCMNE